MPGSFWGPEDNRNKFSPLFSRPNRGVSREGSKLRISCCPNACDRCRGRAVKYSCDVARYGKLRTTAAVSPMSDDPSWGGPLQPPRRDHMPATPHLQVPELVPDQVWSSAQFQRQSTYGDGPAVTGWQPRSHDSRKKVFAMTMSPAHDKWRDDVTSEIFELNSGLGPSGHRRSASAHPKTARKQRHELTVPIDTIAHRSYPLPRKSVGVQLLACPIPAEGKDARALTRRSGSYFSSWNQYNYEHHNQLNGPF